LKGYKFKIQKHKASTEVADRMNRIYRILHEGAKNFGDREGALKARGE
jgi:hypothetical protein